MRWRIRVFLTALGMTLALLPAAVVAHQIPNDVTIRAFLRPEGARLNLLVRVPLEAMRDLQWPTRGPGYLDLEGTDAVGRDAATLWIADNIELFEDGFPISKPHVVATGLALPADRSFGSYQDALARVSGPGLPKDTQLYWEQGMLDVWLQYPIGSDRSEFSIRPAFARLGQRVTTVIFFLPPGRAERAYEFLGDPGLIRLDPRWYQAALRFVQLGFFHILEGADHLLFLLCLMIPLRRFRPLVLVVTSFTVAHSMTLLASAFGVLPDGLWFPPLIETLIASSIVYMAIENVIGGDPEHRWMIAFGFGLVHGFGFSFALRETLQFAGRHLITSLLSFNIGVEMGQLLVLAILIPVLHGLFRFVVTARMGTIILSVLVGHSAWHWMIERGQALSRYSWPELTPATLASGVRWLMAGVILAGLLWLLSPLLRHRLGESEGRVGKD
ncbi:MAG: HupE/UreJ family protein [Acidobacteriota bacterium]